MANKLWYAFNCPFTRFTGIKAVKQGITGGPAVRLGVYQNSFSKDNHTACFDLVYIGPDHAINNLEKAVKMEYDWHIDRDGRGHSEWIGGLNAEDIFNKIDEIIKGYGFLVTKVPKKFLPLTVDNLDNFLKHYEVG